MLFFAHGTLILKNQTELKLVYLNLTYKIFPERNFIIVTKYDKKVTLIIYAKYKMTICRN